MTVYDLAEPIEAYRWWRSTPLWQPAAQKLASVSFQFVWDREVTASPCHTTAIRYNFGPRALPACDGPPCSEPKSDQINARQSFSIASGCGIYALKTLTDALLQVESGGILGKVLLGGKVWPYEKGYRAEKAQIVGLYPPSAFERYNRYFDDRMFLTLSCPVEELAHRYDVEVLEPTSGEHEGILYAAEAHFVASRVGAAVSASRYYSHSRVYSQTRKFPW